MVIPRNQQAKSLEVLMGRGRMPAEYVRTHGCKVDEIMSRDLVWATADTRLNSLVGIVSRAECAARSRARSTKDRLRAAGDGGVHVPADRLLGDARVSTVGQTLDSQLEQLRGVGCTKIFREKVTGAHNDRRELLKMLKHLAPGDVVTVTRIDRLARSTFDLFAIVKQIVDAKAQFRSLAEPWADTETSTGRLMIAVLGGLADVERDLIRTRTAEGRSRATKRGQRMGRKLN